MVGETGVQSQVESYQRLKKKKKKKKMVLDAALLNTQHYKVRIKGKVEQFRERSSALPLHLGVVALETRAFGSLSTKVANFTYIIVLFLNVDILWCLIYELTFIKGRKKKKARICTIQILYICCLVLFVFVGVGREIL